MVNLCLSSSLANIDVTLYSRKLAKWLVFYHFNTQCLRHFFRLFGQTRGCEKYWPQPMLIKHVRKCFKTFLLLGSTKISNPILHCSTEQLKNMFFMYLCILHPMFALNNANLTSFCRDKVSTKVFKAVNNSFVVDTISLS